VRPNVEVNRRAEGTSELNRRLGDGEKGAVALERCGVAGDYGWGCAGKQARRKASSVCLCRPTKAEQQASSLVAQPEHVEVEQQKPKRGLTFELSGARRQGGLAAKWMMALDASRPACSAGGGPLERRVSEVIGPPAPQIVPKKHVALAC